MFALLLSGTDVDTAIPWVNAVVHQVLPVVLIADWLIDPPGTRLSIGQGLIWLIPPIIWIAYTLIRGPIAGWYPYPFLNPANGGYGSVALTSLAILCGGALLCVVLVVAANAMRDRARWSARPHHALCQTSLAPHQPRRVANWDRERHLRTSHRGDRSPGGHAIR